MCYNGSRYCVGVGGENTKVFEVRNGLRQECPIAPCLFNIALEWMMRKTTEVGGLKVGKRNLDRLVYANDVDLMAESKEEVGRKVAEFRIATAHIGLTINEEKTKLMNVTRGEAFVEERVE